MQGNTGPAWTIAEFIAQFVQGLFQFEQAQQSAAGLQHFRSVDFRVARRRIVRGEKRLARFHFPGSRERCEPGGFGVDVRDFAQCTVLH